MKGLISFLKLWTAVSLNAVMPVREHQMKVTAFAGGTYQVTPMLIRQAAFRKKEKRRQSGCRAVRE
nr:hypothetical protein [Bacillus licheniformis]